MSKGKVLIAKETASKWDTKNPKAVSSVNVAQGPRTGNNPSMEKRGEFKSAKAEREPLAKTIMTAYGARAQKDAVDAKAEGISSNTKSKFKK